MSIAISTGTFTSFTSVSSGIGSKQWQNAYGVAAGGGNPAYAILGTAGISQFLKSSAPNYVPALISFPDLSFDGVEFIVRKWQTPGANITDSHVYLLRDYTMYTDVDGVISTPYWPETPTEFTYGGPAYLWGRTEWDLSKFFSSFGVSFQAKTGTEGPSGATAYIDRVYTKVYTSLPDSISVTVTAAPTSGAAPLLVDFLCAFSGGTGPYTTDWDFGDGSTAGGYGATVSHTYTSIGTYTATVSAYPMVGEVGTATVIITVTGASTLLAQAAASPVAGVAPLPVNFSSSISGGTAPYTYSWDFRDGSPLSTIDNPTYTFTVPGVYVPVLTVTDSVYNNVQASGPGPINVGMGVLTVTASGEPDYGSAPLGVNFYVTPSGGVPPYLYSWNFGDGGPISTLQNPSHAYLSPGVYTATVICSDSTSTNATDTVQVEAVAATPLTVSIQATPTNGPSPLLVAFTSTVTGGTAPYTYEWIFGDLLTDITENPSHTYYPGTYQAYLKISDSVMPPGQYVASNMIVITVSGSGSGVTGSPTAVPVSGIIPLSVLCTATGAGGTGPYTYIWDFGDGSPQSTDQVVTHIYTTAGVYPLVLRTEDSLGGVGMSPVITITATASGITPTGSGDAYLSWAGSDDLTPAAQLLFSYYLDPLEATWGGWVSDTSHTYPALAAGSYTFHVRCKDSGGLISIEDTCAFTWAGSGGGGGDAGFISALIQEDLHYSASIPATVNFVGSATGGIPPYTFSWDFGDTTAPVTGDIVAHTYTVSGEFQVVLSVTDSGSGSTFATATKHMGVSGYSVSGTILDYGRSPLTYIKGNQDVGSVAWQNKPDAVSVDGVGAYVTLTNTNSYYLVCKALSGHNITSGTTLVGLEVYVHRMATGSIQDKRITPIRSGLLCDGLALPNHGADHSKTDPNLWASTWEWVVYGGPTDIWDFTAGIDSDQLATKEFGIAIQAEPVSGGGVGRIDSVLVKPYYAGMPVYPLGVAGIVLDAAPPYSLDLGVTGTSDTDGTYILSPLFDGNIYTVEPSYGTGLEPVGWGFSPEGQDIAIATANITGIDFDAFRVLYPLIRKNYPGMDSTIIPGSTFVWKYYYTKSKGTQTLKILVKNIVGGKVDLYVSQNALPDEDDYDYRSINEGTTEEKVLIRPTTGIHYWYIGIRCMTMGASLPVSYTIVVSQPPV